MASCRIPLASCRMRQVWEIHAFPDHEVAKTFEFLYFLLAESRERFKNQHLTHSAGCRWHPAGFHRDPTEFQPHPTEFAKYWKFMHFPFAKLRKHMNPSTFRSPGIENTLKINTWRILQDANGILQDPIGILQDPIGILQNAPSIGNPCITYSQSCANTGIQVLSARRESKTL